MTQRQEFRLPDVGEGLTEAEIVKWHVHPGDTVADGQTIIEIETAKSVVELPSPYHGVVTELLVEEGATVDVGTPIIVVGDPDAAPDDDAPAQGDAEPSDAGPAPGASDESARDGAEPEKREPVLVGYGVKAGATKRRARRTPVDTGAGAQHVAPAAPVPDPAAPAPAPDGRSVVVLAKPPVRKLARDLGVDLAALHGTGPNGTISRADVQAAAGAAPATTRAAPAAGEREERIAIRGVRKHTAAAMVNSAFTAPHVTEFLQIDATETVHAVRRLRAVPEFADVKVSPLLLVAKALLLALRRHPMANASWDEQAAEIVVKHYVNLGIAVATDRGLVVPNVKDAHARPLPELARELAELSRVARDGKTQPAQQQGGTVTITNVGVFGVDAGTPILNPGEAAILAFGQIRDLPWVHEGQVVPRKVTTLALSFDHRIVDGELGSRVLADIGAMLTDPMTMLAWS